jgi:hypothetical protein
VKKIWQKRLTNKNFCDTIDKNTLKEVHYESFIGAPNILPCGVCHLRNHSGYCWMVCIPEE